MSESVVLAKTSQVHPFQPLVHYLNEQILGQTVLVNRLLLALLCDGHLLVEGAPGLAKTKAIKLLAGAIEGEFHRIQFTPDLLPGDLTGTEIYRPETGSFEFQPGPLFHHVVLADEVNRAPAKVQSALLEAMGERQITIGRKTYQLPKLFLVMATQNPLEQAGTYALPEAQLDRFLLQVNIGYPEARAERHILALAREEAEHAYQPPTPLTLLTQAQLFTARRQCLQLHMAPPVEQYLLHLVLATRQPTAYSETLKNYLAYGASPRGTIALDRTARAHAWLAGRDYVTPDDVQAVVYDVLRHRLILSFEAQAQGITCDDVITELLTCVPVT